MTTKEIVEDIKKRIFELIKDHPVMVDQKAFNEIEQQINEHTNSKLRKIIKKIERKCVPIKDEDYVNGLYMGTSLSIEIIKKEIAKT